MESNLLATGEFDDALMPSIFLTMRDDDDDDDVGGEEVLFSRSF